MVQFISNGGFENSTIRGGQQMIGSDADSTKSWGFSGTSGIHTSASWFNGKGSTLVAPNGGANAAFLFGSNGGVRGSGTVAAADLPSVGQTFKAAAGNYALSFYAAQQNAGAGAMVLHVKLKSADGKDFYHFTVTPGQGYTQSTFPVTLRAQIYTLSFAVEPPLYLGQRGATTYSATYQSGMVLIDDVSII